MPNVDANSQGVTLATDQTTGVATKLLVDPITSYLLVAITVASTVTTRPDQDIPVDNDSTGVAFGVTNNASKELCPLLTTSAGILYVDVTVI